MRTVLITALLVASVAMSGCIERTTFERCRGADVEWKDDGTGTICVDNRLRTFLYTVPDEGEGLPLLIALHGGAGDADNMQHKTRLDEYAIEDRFMLIVPDGTPVFRGSDIRTWNAAHCCGQAKEDGTDDVEFLHALVSAAFDPANSWDLDAHRIGITGHSNGGMMAHRMGAEIPLATHIMPVAGAIGGRSPPEAGLEVIPDPAPGQRLPNVLIIHADDDPRVPYEGGEGDNLGIQRYDMSVQDAVDFWEGVGANVTLVTAHGGHGWPGGEADLAAAPEEPDASRLVVDFLLS